MNYVLFNSRSNNNHGEEALNEALKEIEGEKEIASVLDYDDEGIKKLVKSMKLEDNIYIIGGDGTLNHFVNSINDEIPENKIYIYKAGTGNDFINDIKKEEAKFYLINEFLRNLPKVTVNGETKYFFNNVGYGIEGYCCEEADRQKAKDQNKKINYTGIAIKGLLKAFKRKTATIIIDGNEYKFEDVWLAPTMKGRYLGGGMMMAPNQDRLNEEHTCTLCVYHCKSRLKTLAWFPNIFKGKHIKNAKNFHMFTGRKFKVMFNEPCALQIDGETYLNVTEYEVEA